MKLKKVKLCGFEILFIISSLMCSFLNFGMPFGCYVEAMIQPKLIKNKATPSVLQENFSFKIIGAKIALKIIVKHEVDEIKMILPKPSAVPLKI